MNKKKKYLISFMVEVLVLMLGVLTILFAQQRESRQRVYDYLRVQLDRVVSASAQRTSDYILDRTQSVETIAYLYGLELEKGDSSIKILEGTEESSDFIYVRFVDIKGISYTSDGQTMDVSDREYYQRGITGESGETVIYESRFNSQELIGFYAPVYTDGVIRGVVVGFIDLDNFDSIIREEVNGNPASVLILDESGTVVAKNITNREYDINGIGEILPKVKDKDKQEILDAFNSRESVSFEYKGVMGTNKGYLVPIEGTDWFISQYYPVDSIYREIANENIQDWTVFVLIGILFVIISLIFILTVIKQNSDNNKEEDQHKFDVILRSLSDNYMYMMDVNLNTFDKKVYRFKSGPDYDNYLSEDLGYDETFEEYANKVVAAYDRERFIAETKIDNIIDKLRESKDYYIEYDAVIQGQKRTLQGKFTIDNLIFGEPHLFISIKDITVVISERNETQLQMKMLTTAACSVYPFILEINATLNTSRIIFNDGNYKNKNDEFISLDECLNVVSQTIPDIEERVKFVELFDRHNIIDMYNREVKLTVIRYRQIGEDGIVHWVETKLILLEGEEKTICGISLTRNIDEDIVRENEMKDAKEKAEAADRTKLNYIYSIVHEIKTPLNIITGYNSLALKNLDDKKMLEDYLIKTQQAQANMTHIIDSVLDMVKIENEELVLEESATDITFAVDKILTLINPLGRDKEIKFETESDYYHPYIYQDQIKNAKVVANVLRFAIYYANSKETISFALNQLPGKSTDDCIIQFQCKFSGKVIPREIYEIISGNRYRNSVVEREDIEMESLIKGAKDFLEAMGGSLEIHTEEGNHYIINTYTPHKFASSEEVDTDISMSILQNMVKDCRILLVEKDEALKEILETFMVENGIIVDCIKRGKKAIEIIRSKEVEYDIVMIDEDIDDTDVYKMSADIRNIESNNGKDNQIILLTGVATKQNIKKATDSGVNRIVEKPINNEILLSTIAGLLNK